MGAGPSSGNICTVIWEGVGWRRGVPASHPVTPGLSPLVEAGLLTAAVVTRVLQATFSDPTSEQTAVVIAQGERGMPGYIHSGYIQA